MPNIQITLTALIKSKKNNRIVNRKTGRNFPSKAYAEFHKKSSEELKPYIPVTPIDKVQRIEITFYYPDKRRRDIDNGTSSILDLLVDNKILLDDSYSIVGELLIKGIYRKGQPGADIVITTF